VNPNLDSVKNYIHLTNLNPDWVIPACSPFYLRLHVGDEC